MLTMPAITLYQPFAWAFCHGKLVENRDWTPSFAGVNLRAGAPVAIHASVAMTELKDLWEEQWTGWPVGYDHPPPPDAFIRTHGPTGARIAEDPEDPAAVLGAVVAVAIFNRVSMTVPRTSSQEAWRVPGVKYGWFFERSDPLPQPVACRGSRKIWRLTPEVNERVVDLWGRALM